MSTGKPILRSLRNTDYMLYRMKDSLNLFKFFFFRKRNLKTDQSSCSSGEDSIIKKKAKLDKPQQQQPQLPSSVNIIEIDGDEDDDDAVSYTHLTLPTKA